MARRKRKPARPDFEVANPDMSSLGLEGDTSTPDIPAEYIPQRRSPRSVEIFARVLRADGVPLRRLALLTGTSQEFSLWAKRAMRAPWDFQRALAAGETNLQTLRSGVIMGDIVLSAEPNPLPRAEWPPLHPEDERPPE